MCKEGNLTVWLVGALALGVAGCTDTVRATPPAPLEILAHVECYSGDRVLYKGTSVSTIAPSAHGYSFIDSASQLVVEISGHCVIRYPDFGKNGQSAK